MTPSTPTVFNFSARTLDGRELALSNLRGEVLLIFNSASACGFTPQLAGLQHLHAEYAERGLRVIGFPCNQFGAQEPGSPDQISTFCSKNYGVDFLMMAKIDVNGEAAHPLWAWLKKQAPGLLGSQAIKWNFTKFLVGRDGRSVRRYAPQDTPASLRRDIEAVLGADIPASGRP